MADIMIQCEKCKSIVEQTQTSEVVLTVMKMGLIPERVSQIICKNCIEKQNKRSSLKLN